MERPSRLLRSILSYAWKWEGKQINVLIYSIYSIRHHLPLQLSRPCLRYNTLLNVIRQSLRLVEEALCGKIVMSVEIESTFESVMKDQVNLRKVRILTQF